MHCGSMFVYLKPCVKNTILFHSHITLKLVFIFKRTNHRWWIIHKANIAHNSCHRILPEMYDKGGQIAWCSPIDQLIGHFLSRFERVTNWGTRWNEKFYKPCGIYSDCFKLRILIPGKFIRFFHVKKDEGFSNWVKRQKDWNNIGESTVEYFLCNVFAGLC